MDGAAALASAPAIDRNVRAFEMAYTRHVDRKRRKSGGITTANPPQRAQTHCIYGVLNRSPRLKCRWQQELAQSLRSPQIPHRKAVSGGLWLGEAWGPKSWVLMRIAHGPHTVADRDRTRRDVVGIAVGVQWRGEPVAERVVIRARSGTPLRRGFTRFSRFRSARASIRASRAEKVSRAHG
jgi:hypothetical protein